MIKSFFFFARIAFELDSRLKGCQLTEIYSQEADKLILAFSGASNQEDSYLEISCDPSIPYAILRHSFRKAKQNVIRLFDGVPAAPLSSVQIAVFDRALRFYFGEFSFIFFLRGALTNVLCLENNGRNKWFKSGNEQRLEKLAGEIASKPFMDSADLPNYILALREKVSTREELLGLPFFKNDVGRFLEAASPASLECDLQLLANWAGNLLTGDLLLMKSTRSVSLLLPGLVGNEDEIVISSKDPFQIIREYIKLEYQGRKFLSLFRRAERFLDEEIRFAKSKTVQFETIIGKVTPHEELTQKANLLLAHAAMVQKGLEKISVPDFENASRMIEIELDPKLSPFRNADRYFEKAYSRKMEYEKAIRELPAARAKVSELQKLKDILAKIDTLKELESFMEENNIAVNHPGEAEHPIQRKFRQYRIQDKYLVFVGKDAANNDVLTTQFAKQNDFWFHARGCSGSHVVLRTDAKAEKPPKDVLTITASIAAFYSKAKHARIVQVAFTQKKYVVKKKGMPAGQVLLLKESILHVKPEIPPQAEAV